MTPFRLHGFNSSLFWCTFGQVVFFVVTGLDLLLHEHVYHGPGFRVLSSSPGGLHFVGAVLLANGVLLFLGLLLSLPRLLITRIGLVVSIAVWLGFIGNFVYAIFEKSGPWLLASVGFMGLMATCACLAAATKLGQSGAMALP